MNQAIQKPKRVKPVDSSKKKEKEDASPKGSAEKELNIHPHSKKIKKPMKPQVSRFKRDKFGKIVFEKETEEEKKKFFEEIDKFEDFVRTNTSKYKKIRKKTIEVVQVDKSNLKTAVKALLSHYVELKRKLNLMELNHDFINLEITLSKGLEAYNIKPIQM